MKLSRVEFDGRSVDSRTIPRRHLIPLGAHIPRYRLILSMSATYLMGDGWPAC